MGHGHGEPEFKIPNYKDFQVKGIPQLEELEKALEIKGLRDPWIRNEAWRYHPGFGTRLSRARVFLTRGMPLGAALALGGFLLKKTLGGDDHGHGSHGEVPHSEEN